MAKIFEHGYAVVVGVDENSIGQLALPVVTKDVTAVYNVLIHPERCAYDPDNVKLLNGADATSENILDALSWLQKKVKGDKKATAVIYYSGHGMVDQKTDQYYLIPYNIRSLNKIRFDALNAEEFNSEISDIQSDRLLVVLDCCHAAGMDVKDVHIDALEESKNVRETAYPLDLPDTKQIPAYNATAGGKAVSDLIDGTGRAILNSSTGSQSSYIRKDKAMSLFTYHFIEALTGHAPHPDDATVVLVTDVMSWVTREVKKSAAKEGREQTPVMRTTGVFPVAQLIGGKGLSKGVDGLPAAPPDPLAPLPSIQVHDGSVFMGSVSAGGDIAGRDIHKHIGDVIHGDKVGGDKVSGDKISIGTMSGNSGVAIGRNSSIDMSTHTTTNSGDTFNMSGDFRGSNLNINSTLENVIQSVSTLPHADASAKAELIRLVAQLDNLLQQIPAAESRKLSAETEFLIETAASPNPNPTMLTMLGNGLKQTASLFKDNFPQVLDTATKIVTAVITAASAGG